MEKLVTYSCGHKEMARLPEEPALQREELRHLEKFGLCRECWKHSRHEALLEAVRARWLPRLEGNQREVDKARVVRRRFIRNVVGEVKTWMADLERSLMEQEGEDGDARFRTQVEQTLAGLRTARGKTAASWWISNRDLSPLELVELATREASGSGPCPSLGELKALPGDLSIYPGAVEIQVGLTCIRTRYEENDTFRLLMKGMAYRWDPEEKVWTRDVAQFTGTLEDQVVTLGRTLLNNGFAVAIRDPYLRQAINESRFGSKRSRWIAGREETLAILWLGDQPGIYEAARMLPESSWNRPFMDVPVKHWRRVLEFAGTYGFPLTEGATSLISAYEEEMASGED